MNIYTMENRLNIANKGTAEIVQVLSRKSETLAVINVEKDKDFQKIDVDLIWVYKYRGKVHTKFIEIKVDTYAQTGNYFIETVSNEKKQTKGCLLYSKAHYLFYYFIETKELNIIPMEKCRNWILANMNKFVEKKLKTQVGQDGYTSRGRLVPKKILNQSVPGVKTIFLTKYLNIAS